MCLGVCLHLLPSCPKINEFFSENSPRLSTEQEHRIIITVVVFVLGFYIPLSLAKPVFLSSCRPSAPFYFACMHVITNLTGPRVHDIRQGLPHCFA